MSVEYHQAILRVEIGELLAFLRTHGVRMFCADPSEIPDDVQINGVYVHEGRDVHIIMSHPSFPARWSKQAILTYWAHFPDGEDV